MKTLLILADLENFLRAIVPLLAIVFWIVSQFMGNREKAGAPREAARKPIPPRPEKKADADASIREQVEQFLRQAAEQRHRAPAAERSAATPPPIPPQNPKRTRGPKKEAAQKATRELSEVRAKTAQESRFAPSRLSSVGDRHLEETAVTQADERMAERLHQKFDHSLGRLAKPRVSSQSEDEPVQLQSPAALIAAALREPQNVRQAIILSEIMKRPAEF